MRDIENLCINCWNELSQGSVCAECGYDNDVQNEATFLPKQSIIKGQYVVGAVKYRDSDSVTYAGYDAIMDKPILVREFLPKSMANRLEGNLDIHVRQKFIGEYDKLLKSFVKLWTTLEKLHSLSAVVPVYDVFEENQTAYAIIEHIESIPLREYLIRNEQGYIQWDSARLMFMPVLTTIEALHSNGIIHGSITPDSLVLCRDGKVRLSPFPIQQACDISSNMEFVVSDGYTALEQYDNNHKIGTATDIYSFSACVYRALVGSNPPSALDRESNDKLMIPNAIAESIPMHVIKAMITGLQIYPEKRIKEIADFRDLLDAAPAVQAQAAQPVEDVYQEGATGGYPDYDTPVKPVSKKSKTAVIILSILIVIAIGVGIYVVKFSGLANNQGQTTTQPSTYATYEVPNIANNGMVQSDVENEGAWNKQFNFVFQGEYSTDVEAGTIFKQSIAPGEVVEAGTEIILTVSKGIQTVQVPNVCGLDLDTAKKMLEEQGFTVSTVEVYNDGTHTANTVKSNYGMAPEEGSTVAVGSEIILQVYGEAHTQPSTDE